jgi:hypothetical protein
MGAAKGGTTFYVTTERTKRPADHSKKCQCDRCKAAGLRVRAPSPQLALTRIAPRLGIPATALPTSAPPAPPPAAEPTPKPPKPKRALPPAPPAPTFENCAPPPPGGFRAWIDEQRKKP